jgi:hypothetical protein
VVRQREKEVRIVRHEETYYSTQITLIRASSIGCVKCPTA